MNDSALALFAQRTRIPTSARSIGFCVIWVCISSSSSFPAQLIYLLDHGSVRQRLFSVQTPGCIFYRDTGLYVPVKRTSNGTTIVVIFIP